jgi:glyoxylase-like metal-dependent hydrolase (beta-lactamase superfamily II)
MLQTEAAPGIHRVEDANVNWFIVEDGDRLLIVDAGLPSSWRSLHEALRALGRSPSQIEAIVLTHAHFDHIGFAEKARRELGVPVWVHEDDVPLTHHPRQYTRERSVVGCLATHPRALPIFAGLVRERAFFPPPIAEVHRFGGEHALPLAGRPRLCRTPGHTLGHVSLHFPDRDAVIAGDALVTLDPYTARTGPRLVARAATADSVRATATLDAIAVTGATTVLPGHGQPWTGGAAEAVALARAAGSA